MGIKYGCHSYSWQMSLDKYKHDLPRILQVIKNAGFAGVEPDTAILGKFKNDPSALKESIDNCNLELGAISIMKKWNTVEKIEEDLELKEIFDYLKVFPDTILNLLNYPFYERDSLSEQEVLEIQRDTLKKINEISEIAFKKGIECTFHPNSSTGSVFRTQNDYDILFDGLDSRFIGYTPDTGHIVNGGMNVMEVFKQAKDLINHVHFKDISNDKKFVPIGEGIINHDEIVEFLKELDYQGWIMVEDESELSEENPDLATELCGTYIKKYL